MKGQRFAWFSVALMAAALSVNFAAVVHGAAPSHPQSGAVERGGASAALSRVPQGKWAEMVPALEEYAGALPQQRQEALAQFRRRFPSVDPTDRQSFHAALLEKRAEFGARLTDATAAQYHEWIAAMESMQAELVAARGRHIGIALHGREKARDGSTRSFSLIGFDGVTPVYAFTQNAAAAESTGANLVRLNAAYDPALAAPADGSGLYVNVNDHGTIYDENPEFQLPGDGGTRVVYKEINDLGERAHMTHVAGTVGAWGYNANLMGMAPRLWIRSHIQQYSTDITGMGMRYPNQLSTTTNPRTGETEMQSVMGTTSLGITDTNTSRGVYTSTSALYDTTLRDYPYYTHFYAASNDGSAYATLGTDWPVAKNIITIGSVSDVTRDDAGNYVSGGNISSFSSRGPTFDGRIKPDLTANGEGLTSPSSATGSSSMSGTSMATPNASGSATLLIDYIRRKLPGHHLRSSTLKALLVNTATDRGTPGPDYSYGWGVINVKAAADTVKRYAEAPASRVLLEDELAPGQTWTTTYSTDGSAPIRVTLTWLDPAGASQSTTTTDRSPRLVNDLDVRVIHESGTTHQPYVMPFVINGYNTADYGATATTGDNFTDNTEQVYIAAPAAGTYTVQITHDGTLLGGAPQAFSLVVSGMESTAPVAPAITAVSPEMGDGSNNFIITLAGSGFLPGSAVILRRAGSADAHAYGIIPVDNRIECRFDTAALAKGYWDVVVRAPDGTEAVLENGFLLPIAGAGTRHTLYANDFESGVEGLSGDPGWAVGTPLQGALGGPDAAYSGTSVLGYNLNGAYEPTIERWAYLPPVSTIGATTLTLEFRRWLGVAYNQTGARSDRHADYARIEYSLNGLTWSSLWANNAQVIDSAWQAISYALPAAAEDQNAVHIRFGLASDNSTESFGWNIDDVAISGEFTSALPPVFTSEPPTSVAIGDSYNYRVFTSDADTPGTSLAFSASGLPPEFSFSDLGDGTALIAGSPASAGTATITIAVTDGLYTTYQIYDLTIVDPYVAWIGTYAVGSLTGQLDDPDGDGLNNLLEFALLGGDPALAGTTAQPVIGRTEIDGETYLTLTVQKNPAAGNAVVYAAEVSGNLIDWAGGLGNVEIVSETADTLVARDLTPLPPSGAGRYIRLSVTAP